MQLNQEVDNEAAGKGGQGEGRHMGTKTVVSTEGPGYCPLGEVLLIPGSAGADPGFFEGGGGGVYVQR